MAITKAKLIADGVITVDNLHASHGITTTHIGEGEKLFYTDARVSSYLTSNNYTTSAGGYFYDATLSANILTFSKSDGTTDSVDLSLYLDDTNLARLVSGTLDGQTGIATFTRDDSSTFTIDFSAFLSDANDYVSSGSFNTTTGVLTLTRLGGGTVTVDLDGKYAEASHTHLWAHITDRPTALSAFTNDLGNYGGFLTSFTETDPVYVASSWYTTTNNANNWNTAYGWGNHATAGYLTSFTETDPTVPSHVKSITTTNISNWDTAYGWGDHADGGYQAAATAITTSNISSQSVNYANTAGSTSYLSALGAYVWNASTNGRDFNQGIQTSFVSASESYPSFGSVVRVHTYPNDGGSAELYFPYSSTYGGSSMRYRLGQYDNAGWTGWKTVIDSDNIGSQSVSYATSAGNADTVDSLHASSFVRRDQNAVTIQRHLDASTAWTSGITSLFLGWYGGKVVIGNNNDSLHDAASAEGANSIVLTNTTYSFKQTYMYHDNSLKLYMGTDGTRNTGWAYHTDNGAGLHWPNNGWHLFPHNDSDFRIYSGNGANVSLRMETNGTTRGYVYAENDNTIGFLNNSRGWSFRTYSNGNALVYGYLTVNGGGTSSSIFMNDTDEGQREIHCNSNRIGFLTQTGSWGSYLDDSNNWYADGSMRAPIFYDSNNTAHYIDAAGGSNIRNLYVGDSGDSWSDPGGWGTQVRFSNGPHVKFVLHARTPGIEAGMYVHTPSSVYIGSYTSHPVNMMVGGSSKLLIEDGRVYSHVYSEAAGSSRAPIFYDSNNTSYYIDGASESQLAKLKLIDATSGYDLMLGPYTLSRTYNDSDRHGIVINSDLYPHIDLNATTSSESNVTHGATISMTGKLGTGFRRWVMGIAQYNPNELSFGYYDNQANPHYGVGINWSYPAKMWIDTAGDLYSTGSMRSPIFYDSNNTGYYVNPASQSNVDDFRAAAYRGNANVGGTGTATWHPDGIYVGSTQWLYGTQYRNGATTSGQGWLYMDTNYGHSIVGLYTSTRYQGVWSMGDSYKLPADGTSIGNLYGMAWSHPNAGGVAGNLNTHGLLVTENGSFLAAVSGSIRSRDDMRAPVFYDSNDTGYYLDPHATSNLNVVQAKSIRNDGSVASDDGFGIYWSNDAETSYAIYREPGGWAHPFSDLRIAFHTGIKLGANASYNGIRFYTDYDMATQVMSVNNSSDGYGAGHVHVNGIMHAGDSHRAPVFYDSNDTSRYLDPNNTSVLQRIFMYKNNTAADTGNTCIYLDNAATTSGTTYNLMSDVSSYFGSRHLGFMYNGVIVGYIGAPSTTSVNYSTTSSDLRLKKNIEPWLENILDKFEDIEPKLFNFNFQEEGESKDRGFIAQEMVDKFPEAYPHDYSLDDGESGYYSFNPSGMVVYLMKALKEQTEINKSLISRIEALENK